MGTRVTCRFRGLDLKFWSRPRFRLLPHPSPSRMSSSSSSPASMSDQETPEYLANASFTRTDQGNVPAEAVTATDLLMGAYDPTKLHPLAQLGDKLDYLLLDEEKTSEIPGAGTAIPSRGWSDDLCYGTGTMYLSGSYGSLSTYSFRPCVFA